MSGRGEAEVFGSLRFHGRDEHLGSILRYVVPEAPATLDAASGTPVRLSWRTDLRAGNDAHCGSQERATLLLAPGGSGTLPRERAEAVRVGGHIPLFGPGFPQAASAGAKLVGHGTPLWAL